MSAQNETMPVIRSRRLLVVDATMAALLGALIVYTSFRPMSERMWSGPVWIRVLIAAVSAAAVALRRVTPLTALGAAALSSIAALMLGFERDSFLIVALVLYIIAASRPPRRSVLLLAAVVATATAVYVLVPTSSTVRPNPPWWQLLGLAATPVLISSVGWALGLAVYRQRSYVVAVRTQAAQEVRAQAELAARSAAEERLRIARELHDVVAHAMSVITVQAGVARYIDAEMPERASAALGTIESTGRQALRDMRQLLGVLRAEGEQAASSPAPALADLDELVAGLRAAGTRVDLRVGGEVRRLPEGLELSAYRIVQEALTNVVKHAATDHARVDLRYRPEELAIEIVDDGAGARTENPASGHGLVGMRERAALHGGSLQAGPLPLRGYRVAARLPIAGPLEAVSA
ncbi:MAG TPA: sensor histidine kinase [Actinospica sp.]|nr:sensor histidine kinase [Actinospica sp.]